MVCYCIFLKSLFYFDFSNDAIVITNLKDTLGNLRIDLLAESYTKSVTPVLYHCVKYVAGVSRGLA